MLSLGDWGGGGVIRSKEGKGGTSRAQRGTLARGKGSRFGIRRPKLTLWVLFIPLVNGRSNAYTLGLQGGLKCFVSGVSFCTV